MYLNTFEYYSNIETRCSNSILLTNDCCCMSHYSTDRITLTFTLIVMYILPLVGPIISLTLLTCTFRWSPFKSNICRLIVTGFLITTSYIQWPSNFSFAGIVGVWLHPWVMLLVASPPSCSLMLYLLLLSSFLRPNTYPSLSYTFGWLSFFRDSNCNT